MRSGSTALLRVHPSVLLFSACGVLLLILALPWPAVGWSCLLVLAAALLYSTTTLLRLLRRSRWLLLATLLLFVWVTPGMPVSWLPGATQDGLHQALEQITRLIASIAMVAILLATLDKSQLVAACYGLLAPLRCSGMDVERWVIRLALTLKGLDAADSTDKANDNDNDPDRPITIPSQTFRAVDYGVLTLLVVLLTTTGMVLL